MLMQYGNALSLILFRMKEEMSTAEEMTKEAAGEPTEKTKKGTSNKT